MTQVGYQGEKKTKLGEGNICIIFQMALFFHPQSERAFFSPFFPSFQGFIFVYFYESTKLYKIYFLITQDCVLYVKLPYSICNFYFTHIFSFTKRNIYIS